MFVIYIVGSTMLPRILAWFYIVEYIVESTM